MPRQIRFFANLWTLTQYPSATDEWSLEDKFAAVKDAGFEGIGGLAVPEVIPLREKHGFDYILYINADRPNWEHALRDAVQYQPQRVNIHLMDHDTTPEDATALWSDMVELAENLGLAMDLEIHRDTATETPEKSDLIRELFLQRTGREIEWSLDHSHFATVKHLNPPFAPRLLDKPALMEHVRHIHFRPFNGHHAQIPATDGHGNAAPEFAQYMDFSEALLQHWLACTPDDAILYACPENGPGIVGNYGLSCFPDVWHDAIFTRDSLRDAWDSLTRTDPS